MTAPDVAGAVTLRIRFDAGERPYRFWMSKTPSPPRYKVLSKRRADGTLEVLAIEETAGGERRSLAQLEIPRDAPSGWLDRWVETWAEELGARFERFDLGHVRSADEWARVAGSLGWRTVGG